MKRVLLDHCVPRPFGRLLGGFHISTAMEMGWARLKNGELLDAAELAGFDVLITADQNLRYQQNLAGRKIAIVELPTNRLRLVTKYADQVRALLTTISVSGYQVVTTADN